jgi:hypothetical protein
MSTHNKSKTKGNRYENHVYDTIRKQGIWVRKSKGSGNAADNKGDLETFNTLIECKHYKKATDKLVSKWFLKVRNEAIAIDKFPLLFVKENYKTPMVYYTLNPSSTTLSKMPFDEWMVTCLPAEWTKINLWEYTSRAMPNSDADKPTYIG